MSSLPHLSVNAADQYRRWLDDGKVFTCTDLGGGVIQVALNNQNVEFNALPVDAEFTINYIDNGVNTPNGPYTVEQTSGTLNYGNFAENFTSYPLTFEFRIDTLINSVVVYTSSLSVSCSADGTSPVTPTNVDVSLGTDPFRRWLDDGKVFTCTDTGSGIDVGLSNQDVEFNNLPVDAEFTLNYIDNGVNTPNGPYTVEQTSGTLNYGAFSEGFPSYPLTFEFRIDTLINGVVVYQSSIGVACSADANRPGYPHQCRSRRGGGTALGGCPSQIPDGSVQGRIPQTINALFEPNADAITDVVLPAGSSWWIIGAEGGFYELWITCDASPVWVAAGDVTPNYDVPWNGAPLPSSGG